MSIMFYNKSIVVFLLATIVVSWLSCAPINSQLCPENNCQYRIEDGGLRPTTGYLWEISKS